MNAIKHAREALRSLELSVASLEFDNKNSKALYELQGMELADVRASLVELRAENKELKIQLAEAGVHFEEVFRVLKGDNIELQDHLAESRELVEKLVTRKHQ